MSADALQQAQLRMSAYRIHNGVVYLSGQVSTVSDDYSKQVKDIFKKIDTLLAKAGSSKRSLLHVTVHLQFVESIVDFNRLWDEWLVDCPKPCRTTVGADLAKLFNAPSLKVEITVIAAVEQGTT